MKKLLASVIVLMLLISCCLIAAFPVSAADINYDEWEIYDGVVVEYTGDSSEIIIPSIDKDGNEVQIVDYQAFLMQDSLKTVYICEGITELRARAFYKCTSLAEVSLPYSLEILGDYDVFKGTAVRSLVIPGNVDTIPGSLVVAADGVFTDFFISYGVKNVRTEATYVHEQKELIFPSTVECIEGFAWDWHEQSVDAYILNPDCELGTLRADMTAYLPGSPDNKGAKHVYTTATGAPIIMPYGNMSATVTLHVPQSAVAKTEKLVDSWVATVKKLYETAKIAWPGDDYRIGYKVVGMTDAEVAEKDQYTKDNGIVSPTKYQMKEPGVLYVAEEPTSSGTNSNGGSGNGNNNNNNNNNNGKNNGNNGNNGDNGGNNVIYQGNGIDLSGIVPILLIAGGVFLLIIIAVIVVVIILTSKKNGKKKKKKAAAEPAEAEPVIEETIEEPETPAEE